MSRSLRSSLALLCLVAGCLGCSGGADPRGTLELSARAWERWAGSRGLDPAVVDPEALRQFALSRLLVERYASLSADLRAPIERRLSDARTDWALQQVEARLRAQVDVSEEAVAAAFEEDRRRWTRPRMVRISHLSVSKEVGEAAALREVAEISERLNRGEPFGEVARRYSDSQNAFRGGEIGWARSEQLAPIVATAIARLDPGEVTPPLETTRAWLMIRLDAEREEEPMSLEEAAPRVRLRLQRLGVAEGLARIDEGMEEHWSPLSTPSGPAGDPGRPIVEIDGRAPISWNDVDRFAKRRHPFVDFAALPAARVGELARHLAREQYREDYAERSGWLDVEAWAERATALRARATLAALLAQRVEPPTDSEVRAAFERNRERLGQESRVKITTLRLDLEPEDSQRHRAAEAIVERLRRDEVTLVEARLELDPEQHFSRLERHGWLDANGLKMLGPFVGEMSKDLARGEVRGPILQDRFLFIVLCEAERGDGQVNWEDMREETRQRVTARRQAEARKALVEELLDGREVVLVADR